MSKKKVKTIEISEDDDVAEQLFGGLDLVDKYCDVHRVYPLTFKGQKISGLLDRLQPPFDLMDIKDKFGGGVFKLNIKNAKNQFVRSGKVEIAGPPNLFDSEETEKPNHSIELAESKDDIIEGLRAEIEEMRDELSRFRKGDGSDDMDTYMKKLGTWAVLIRSMDNSKDFMQIIAKNQGDGINMFIKGLEAAQDLSGENTQGDIGNTILMALATALSGGNLGKLLGKIKPQAVESPPEAGGAKPALSFEPVPGKETLKPPQIEEEQDMSKGQGILGHMQLMDNVLGSIIEDIESNKPAEQLAKEVLLLTGAELSPWLKQFNDETVLAVMKKYVQDPSIIEKKKDYLIQVLNFIRNPG